MTWYDFGDKFAKKALAAFLKAEQLDVLAQEHGFKAIHDQKFHYTIYGSDGKVNRLGWNYQGTDGQKKDRSVRRTSEGFRGVGRYVVDFEGEAVPISKKYAIDPYYHESLTVINHDKESTRAPIVFNDKERAKFVSTYSTAVDELATTADSLTIYTRIQADHKFDGWDAVAVQFKTVEGKKVRQCTPFQKIHHDEDHGKKTENLSGGIDEGNEPDSYSQHSSDWDGEEWKTERWEKEQPNLANKIAELVLKAFIKTVSK